ncbi:MAG: SLC26A/SulP transporter family protein [Rubrivivax sp.]|nr:SLC26A/SulP transporter family protein [Rubrivivax sp.]
MNSTAPPAVDAGRALRSVGAGAVGALAMLAVLLTLGLLAFAPLGPAAALAGVPGAFAAAVAGSAVVAAFSRASIAIAAPSSATAVTLAALMVQLARDPQLAAALAAPTSPEQLAEAARLAGSAAAAAVLGMGLAQLVLAACGLARLAHFVPQPVLAGFINGVALLIVLSQVPALLGGAAGLPLAQWLVPGVSSLAALALGLGTAACITWVGRKRPAWPALLVGLVAGLLVAEALQLAWPQVPLGTMVGAITPSLPPGHVLAPWWDDGVLDFVRRHAGDIALTALLLALIGSLESMLSIVSIEQGSGRRVRADRELAAVGLANVAGALVGALPVVHLRAGALAVQRAGGNGATASLAFAAAAAALFVLGGPALDWVPQSVLAGVMLMVGFGLVDAWSLRVAARWWQASRQGRLAAGDDTPLGLLVMLVVCTLTVTLGVAWGVAVGVALSLVVFVRRVNRALVRDQLNGMARPSRRIYPGAIEARLIGLRTRIALLELEGALFFGSGAQLPERVDALPPPVRFVIFDLRRVSTVDESGAMLLHDIAKRLAHRGQQLLLAGAAEGAAVASGLAAFVPWSAGGAPRRYADADQAMEAAETALLAEAAQGDPALADLLATETELPLAACSLVRGLTARELRVVGAAMRRRELVADEVVFRRGDEAEALYVVTRGSVSAVVRAAPAPGTHGEGGVPGKPDAPAPVPRVQRFASLGPGTMFGEMALVDQAGRSADAVADGPACLQVLSRESLDQLMTEHPEVAAKLYRNIAAHLGERLRVASMAWQAAAA